MSTTRIVLKSYFDTFREFDCHFYSSLRTIMSRMRKPGWNPCEEFKKHNKKRETSVDDVAGLENTKTESEKSSSSRPTRIKTLTQAARSEVASVKVTLKEMLPKLSTNEVRRYRIPFYDSVVLELEEEGMRDSAEYVIKLFELDEEMRIKAGPGSAIWRKPRLKKQKNFLERLKSGLTAAEIAKTSGKPLVQAMSLLDTALFFESETWEWFWIAEQLYRSSLKVAESIEDDDGQTLNAIRFLYGRFLFDKMKDPQEAVNYLNDVRIASEGKVWNVSKIIGVKQESLYRESCTLLHKALLTLTRQLRNENPEVSVKAATFALERATDSVHDEYISAALYELGKSQLSAGNVKLALRHLSKFLAVSKRIPDPEGVCNAHMELAFAYKELEDSEGTVKHLSLLRECAEKFQLPYKLAQAHYYTGEYLLNKNQANLATPHLETALRQFNSLGKTAESNRARCAAGVSKGQEIMDRYINLILHCGARDPESTLKICQWKNNRTPFWIINSEEGSRNDDEVIEQSDDGKERSPISDNSLKTLISLSSSTRSKSSAENEEIVAPIEEERCEVTEET